MGMDRQIFPSNCFLLACLHRFALSCAWQRRAEGVIDEEVRWKSNNVTRPNSVLITTISGGFSPR
jgi:hypothetical protein